MSWVMSMVVPPSWHEDRALPKGGVQYFYFRFGTLSVHGIFRWWPLIDTTLVNKHGPFFIRIFYEVSGELYPPLFCRRGNKWLVIMCVRYAGCLREGIRGFWWIHTKAMVRSSEKNKREPITIFRMVLSFQYPERVHPLFGGVSVWWLVHCTYGQEMGKMIFMKSISTFQNTSNVSMKIQNSSAPSGWMETKTPFNPIEVGRLYGSHSQ